jgi:hypothetical protein
LLLLARLPHTIYHFQVLDQVVNEMQEDLIKMRQAAAQVRHRPNRPACLPGHSAQTAGCDLLQEVDKEQQDSGFG